MPDWNPLLVGLLAGLVSGSLWSLRTVWKQFGVAGFWMLIEARFWRSLVTGFAITFLLGGIVFSLLAAIVWLLHGVALRLV